MKVVAISVDSPQHLAETRASTGAEFLFLSDSDGQVLDVFGVRHEMGSMDGQDIAQSASFLVDSTGRLEWMKVAATYRVRPRPEEILEAADRLQEISQGS